MIIYFEGPDGSGKSTLITYLSRRLDQLQRLRGIKIVEHAERMIPTRPYQPNRIEPSALMTKLTEMATDNETVYILDRGPLSDIIYCAFNGYRPVISLSAWFAFWLNYSDMITMVYCDSDVAEEMMLARGDNYPIAVQYYKQIRYMYQQVMPMFSPCRYDMAKHKTSEDMLARVNIIIATMFAKVERRKNIDSHLYGLMRRVNADKIKEEREKHIVAEKPKEEGTKDEEVSE